MVPGKEIGKDGMLFTNASITLTLLLRILLGKHLGIDKKISKLVAVKTAICGGSAIAAVSTIVKADERQISVANVWL